MADDLVDGNYRIISLTEGERPTGIDYTNQLVGLGKPIDVWTIKKDSEGRTFTLSIGGYPYTRIVDQKVAVTSHPEENVEWIATRRQFDRAWTIQPAREDIMGWAVPPDLQANPLIEMRPIRSTQLFIYQLFRFVRAD